MQKFILINPTKQAYCNDSVFSLFSLPSSRFGLLAMNGSLNEVVPTFSHSFSPKYFVLGFICTSHAFLNPELFFSVTSPSILIAFLALFPSTFLDLQNQIDYGLLTFQLLLNLYLHSLIPEVPL